MQIIVNPYRKSHQHALNANVTLDVLVARTLDWPLVPKFSRPPAPLRAGDRLGGIIANTPRGFTPQAPYPEGNALAQLP